MATSPTAPSSSAPRWPGGGRDRVRVLFVRASIDPGSEVRELAVRAGAREILHGNGEREREQAVGIAQDLCVPCAPLEIPLPWDSLRRRVAGSTVLAVVEESDFRAIVAASLGSRHAEAPIDLARGTVAAIDADARGIALRAAGHDLAAFAR